MKKYLLIIFTLITINVHAYENDYFEIKIEDNWTFDDSIKGIYRWDNNDNEHESLIITFTTNISNDNIKNYNDENVNKYEEYINNKLNEQLKEYDISVEVSNTKKELINNYWAISYNSYWPTKKIIGYDIYQKGYSWTTRNYVYVLTFTSDKELSNNETISSLIKSIELLDKEIIDIKSLQIQLIIIVGSAVAVIGYIIRVIVKLIIKRHKSQ